MADPKVKAYVDNTKGFLCDPGLRTNSGVMTPEECGAVIDDIYAPVLAPDLTDAQLALIDSRLMLLNNAPYLDDTINAAIDLADPDSVLADKFLKGEQTISMKFIDSSGKIITEELTLKEAVKRSADFARLNGRSMIVDWDGVPPMPEMLTEWMSKNPALADEAARLYEQAMKLLGKSSWENPQAQALIAGDIINKLSGATPGDELFKTFVAHAGIVDAEDGTKKADVVYDKMPDKYLGTITKPEGEEEDKLGARQGGKNALRRIFFDAWYRYYKNSKIEKGTDFAPNALYGSIGALADKIVSEIGITPKPGDSSKKLDANNAYDVEFIDVRDVIIAPDGTPQQVVLSAFYTEAPAKLLWEVAGSNPYRRQIVINRWDEVVDQLGKEPTGTQRSNLVDDMIKDLQPMKLDELQKQSVASVDPNAGTVEFKAAPDNLFENDLGARFSTDLYERMKELFFEAKAKAPGADDKKLADALVAEITSKTEGDPSGERIAFVGKAEVKDVAPDGSSVTLEAKEESSGATPSSGSIEYIYGPTGHNVNGSIDLNLDLGKYAALSAGGEFGYFNNADPLQYPGWLNIPVVNDGKGTFFGFPKIALSVFPKGEDHKTLRIDAGLINKFGGKDASGLASPMFDSTLGLGVETAYEGWMPFVPHLWASLGFMPISLPETPETLDVNISADAQVTPEIRLYEGALTFGPTGLVGWSQNGDLHGAAGAFIGFSTSGWNGAVSGGYGWLDSKNFDSRNFWLLKLLVAYNFEDLAPLAQIFLNAKFTDKLADKTVGEEKPNYGFGEDEVDTGSMYDDVSLMSAEATLGLKLNLFNKVGLGLSVGYGWLEEGSTSSSGPIFKGAVEF